MQAKSPKLSIITVVFNGALTIQKAIDSVTNQTFKDIEYIIVDGGSTDGTVEILQKNNDERMFWNSESDQGIYDAMNKGVRMASGNWLYFLGSDDIFYNEYVLEKVFKENTEEVDIIYGNVYDLTLKREYDGQFDLKKLLLRNICHQGIFYRKEVFHTIGFYNINYRLFADWDFNIRCYLNPKIRIRYIDEIIAFYAKGGASAAYNDVSFFRNSLFPARLDNLEKLSLHEMKSVIVYDQWWRLLRSCRIGKGDTLKNTIPAKNVPPVIHRMFQFQRKIPYSVLKIGVFSKSFMLMSYLLSRLFR